MPERRIATVLATVGAVITAAGTAMYVLPGPGFPVLVIGLAVLAIGLVIAAARRGTPGVEGRGMTGMRHWKRFVWSVAAWWIVLSLALWLLGKALDEPASLAACAASAALLVVVGEVGDGLRRRLGTRRHRS